jgi:hypothetical protein
MKYIKNTTQSNKTWIGKVVEPDEYYLIPEDKENAFGNDATVITDITSGEAIIAKDDTGNNDIADIVLAINYLKNLTTPSVANINQPFASKILSDGKKLYTRIHGISATVSGAADNIDFSVPYNNCKITGIEIFNGELGDKINLKILDTPTGTISGVANYTLNQFGFNVYIDSAMYRYQSNYDADLIKDMVLRLEYDAITADESPKTVYVNIILHEVKD